MAKLAPAAAEAMQEMVASSIPLGRMGKKGDIALACVYLCRCDVIAAAHSMLVGPS